MPSFRSGFRALAVRNYRLFWIGQTVSQTGSWMQMTAQAWLVLQLTKSPFEIGLVVALQFTPALLLSLFGGAVADRVDRHRMLFVTQSLAAVQALLFAVLVSSGQIQLGHVFALALFLGLVNALDGPVRQSFVPGLVRREDLPNAIALNSLIISLSRVIGPGLAGLLIATVGMPVAFWCNFASYVGIMGALALMDRRHMAPRSPNPPSGVWAGVRETFGIVRSRPPVAVVLILMGFFGTFGYNFMTIIPLIGGLVLKVDAAKFGGLASAQAVGAIAGGLLVGFLGPPNLRRLFVAGGLFAVMLAVCALVPVYWVVALLLGMAGMAAAVFSTTSNTSVQLGVPDEARGRVISLYFMVFAGTTPIGALFVGSASAVIGVPMTLVVCSSLCGVGLLVGAAYWRRNGRRASGEGVAREPVTTGARPDPAPE